MTMQPLQEIESTTAANWQAAGTIIVTAHGEENTYYIDEFERVYFAKNVLPGESL